MESRQYYLDEMCKLQVLKKEGLFFKDIPQIARLTVEYQNRSIYASYDAPVIWSVVTNFKYRRQGYMTKLFKMVLNFLPKVYLLVERSNTAAFNLYTKLGFVEFKSNEYVITMVYEKTS